MLLALDVGNSNLTIGLYENRERLADWRLQTERGRTADEYAVLLTSLFSLAGRSLAAIDAVVIANVVPPTARPIADLCRRYLHAEPCVVGEALKPPMPIDYRPATDVGADRLVDAYAASRLHGTPVIVVDLGTGTTFNAVSAEGHYLGGAIAPGIGVSLEALFRSAARLQAVDLVRPPRAIGRSTSESIQAGVLFGYAAMVDGMVGRFRAELGAGAKVVATGGLAELIGPETESVDVIDPYLTLDGLSLLWHDSRSQN